MRGDGTHRHRGSAGPGSSAALCGGLPLKPPGRAEVRPGPPEVCRDHPKCAGTTRSVPGSPEVPPGPPEVPPERPEVCRDRPKCRRDQPKCRRNQPKCRRTHVGTPGGAMWAVLGWVLVLRALHGAAGEWGVSFGPGAAAGRRVGECGAPRAPRWRRPRRRPALQPQILRARRHGVRVQRCLLRRGGAGGAAERGRLREIREQQSWEAAAAQRGELPAQHERPGYGGGRGGWLWGGMTVGCIGCGVVMGLG